MLRPVARFSGDKILRNWASAELALPALSITINNPLVGIHVVLDGSLIECREVPAMFGRLPG
jgi:hypothetical protein